MDNRIIFGAVIKITILTFTFKTALASTGDRSQMFYSCLQNCLSANCTDNSEFSIPLYLKILQWSCSDECKYICMWPTVEWFVSKGIGVQQFYGKWPFVRILGMQEPAAVISSLLNLFCHFSMIQYFRRRVVPSAPFYYITHVFCFVCCHGWLWSAIFHTRDLRFTEIMDYLSALSMVLFSVYHLLVRTCGRDPLDPLSLCFAFIIGAYFIYHSFTVFFIRMDYGYNMICNIVLGLLNVIGWLIWCWKKQLRQPYVWRCGAFVLLVALTTLLEIGDFPPLWWIFDAHALWHLSTSPLAILWYKFLVDDCHYLQEQRLSFDKVA